MKLTWISKRDLPAGYIPCCPGLVRAEDGREYLPQTDYEWPGVARDLGWNMADVQNIKPNSNCQHEGTDGTVACPDCGLEAGDFIAAAYDYLVEAGGRTFEGDYPVTEE